MPTTYNRKAVWSWGLYDWANSAFATTVMAGFFPIFFKEFWSADTAATDTTFYLGAGNSIASLMVVMAAPILGAMADRGGLRKRMLSSFACCGALATGGLFLVTKGMWPAAIFLYGIGVVGFAGANVFYNALLVAVSNKSERHRVSAIGYSLGYLGGGLLFLINVMMTLQPVWFGLSDAGEGVRWSFVSVAVWWLVFTLPLLFNVKEPAATEAEKRIDIRGAFTTLFATAQEIRNYKPVLWLLLAYWLYIDGIHTIQAMAVDYGLSIGLESTDLIKALLLVQFVGFPATLMFGWIGQKYGARRGIWITLWTYVAVTIFAVTLTAPIHFYILAAVIGLVQGGVQSLSRSLFSQLIPQEKSAEFFGFYSIVGKSATIAGPLLVGITAKSTGDPRLGMLSILILIVLGMLFFTRVREPQRSPPD